MTDSGAPSPEVSASAHPAVVLREVLESRVARVEEEIALIERQYRQLQQRINQGQERRDAADAIWRVMLTGLDRYSADDVRAASEEFNASSSELALAEQRFDDLSRRLSEAGDRTRDFRGDLELLANMLRHGGNAPAPDSNAFRSTSRRVFQIIEEERMRIARDMHDGPAQSLANLVLQAEILERLIARDPQMVVTELADFKNGVRTVLDDTRRLIFDLRPMTLDDLGLVPTLRKFVKEFGERGGVNAHLRVVGEETRLPGGLEPTLFRIIQEALNNARKHAQATTVEVIITFQPAQVSAVVRDDGVGMDVADVEAHLDGSRNLGLISMRERAELEKGRIDIRSQVGKGTEVRVTFDL